MPAFIAPDLTKEVAALGTRYGEPRVVDVTLPMGGVRFSAIQARRSRVAEVVFAIQRPNGRLITQTKASYPTGVYRLPSGGIHHGETIEGALLREVAEETSLRAEVQRFLAFIRYTLTGSRESRRFTSYAFLLRETGGELHAADQHEHVTGFGEVSARDLPALAVTLEGLGGSADPGAAACADWGRFRAVVHRVLAAELLGEQDGRRAGGAGGSAESKQR